MSDKNLFSAWEESQSSKKNFIFRLKDGRLDKVEYFDIPKSNIEYEWKVVVFNFPVIKYWVTIKTDGGSCSYSASNLWQYLKLIKKKYHWYYLKWRGYKEQW